MEAEAGPTVRNPALLSMAVQISFLAICEREQKYYTPSQETSNRDRICPRTANERLEPWSAVCDLEATSDTSNISSGLS